MTYKPAFLVAVLSVWIGIAGADGIKSPPTKEGLWETHSTRTQQGKTVSDSSAKMCQSNELTKSMQSNAEELRKKNECTSSVTQPSTNTYVEERRCAKGPNAGSVTKVVYTYQGDTASHTEMHMNVGQSESVMIMDTKYLGSCPAGMKPGDLIMDGKIISRGN
jgi:Ca2+-dependent lipid-binding protein